MHADKMDFKFEEDDGDDLFLSQSAEKIEKEFEHYEENMLSQVADFLQKDYCLEQEMMDYVPVTSNFDLLDVNFDLGYLLTDIKPEIKPDVKPEINLTDGRFQAVSDPEMEQLVQNQKNN